MISFSGYSVFNQNITGKILKSSLKKFVTSTSFLIKKLTKTGSEIENFFFLISKKAQNGRKYQEKSSACCNDVQYQYIETW